MKTIGKIIISSSLILFAFVSNAQEVVKVVKAEDMKELNVATPPAPAKRIANQPVKKNVRPMKKAKMQKGVVKAIPVKQK